MVKVAYCSDLHLDCYGWFNGYTYPDIDNKKGADILIIAGDLYEYVNREEHMGFIRQVASQYKHILLVEGNHEFYKSDVKYFKTDKIYPDNVIILRDNTFQYEDVLFYGGPLWCNILELPKLDIFNITSMIADFRYIGYDGMAILPEVMAKMHSTYIENLIEAQMKADSEGLKMVAISHFAPSHKSVAPQYKGNALNPYFVNELDDLIKTSNIKFWVSGHVHNAYRYKIGNTTMLCNPRGYGHEVHGNYKVKYFDL